MTRWVAMLLLLPTLALAEGSDAPITPAPRPGFETAPTPNPKAPALCGYTPHVRAFPVELLTAHEAGLLDVEVDLGFDTAKRLRVKLVGIKGPSRHCDSALSDKACKDQHAAWQKSVEAVTLWFAQHKNAELRPVTSRLAYVCDGTCLNYELVASKAAEYRCGRSG